MSMPVHGYALKLTVARHLVLRLHAVCAFFELEQFGPAPKLVHGCSILFVIRA